MLPVRVKVSRPDSLRSMVAVALVATTVTVGCARATEAKPVDTARMAIRKRNLTPIRFFMPTGYALSHFYDVGGLLIKRSVFVRQITEGAFSNRHSPALRAQPMRGKPV